MEARTSPMAAGYSPRRFVGSRMRSDDVSTMNSAAVGAARSSRDAAAAKAAIAAIARQALLARGIATLGGARRESPRCAL